MLILCCSGCSNQGIYSLKSEMSDKNDSMVELSKEISADAPTEEENAADSSVEETENSEDISEEVSTNKSSSEDEENSDEDEESSDEEESNEEESDDEESDNDESEEESDEEDSSDEESSDEESDDENDEEDSSDEESDDEDEESEYTDRTFSEYMLSADEEYYEPVENSLSTEYITYTHNDHTKDAVVYLPPEYDETKKYNIVYIVGGVSTNETAYFGEPGSNRRIKNMLDNMILNGDIETCIFVNLSFYPSHDIKFGDIDTDVLLNDFNDELREAVIPAVESTYSTYAKDTTYEGIKASREHRAFAGFSLGGAVAWHILGEDVDYFARFIPMSAGCFNDDRDDQTYFGEDLIEKLSDSDLDRYDFFVYACEGTEDHTKDKMDHVIDCLRYYYTYTFQFTENDMSEGNITYKLKYGAKHDAENVLDFVYSALIAIWGRHS